MKKVKKIVKKCLFCEKEFLVLPCKNKQAFCSKRCFYNHRIKNGMINKWSKKYDSCIHCGKTEYKHWTRGYCFKCKNYEPGLIAIKKQWAKANKEILNKKAKKYRLTPSGKAVMANNRHKRRKKYDNTDITTSWLRELWNKTTQCELCGIELENHTKYPRGKHLDHIIPLCANGARGLHIRSNVRYICALCNLTR